MADTPGSYYIDDAQYGRVLVCVTSLGKGYSPVDLIEKGEIEKAARVAADYFRRGL